MKNFFLFLIVFSSCFSLANAADVVDIYSGKWSPCQSNSTYTYDYNTLQYACIIQKSDGSSSLILNGKEDPLYVGAEKVYFTSSGVSVINLRKWALQQIIIGNYSSPWYLILETTFDTQGNFIIIFQDSEGYGWSYNGEVKQSKMATQNYAFTFFSSESFWVLESNVDWGYYNRISIWGKYILPWYSHIYYQGEYMRKNTSVLIFLAQKWEKVEVIAYKKNGTITRLQSVPGNLSTYRNFSIKADYSQFAFILSEWEKYRIVTEKWMLPEVYDSIPWLRHYEKLWLYKQVLRDGKSFFSLWKKSYGPYDIIGELNVTNSGKSWFITVTRGDKEYLIVNGKEISF